MRFSNNRCPRLLVLFALSVPLLWPSPSSALSGCLDPGGQWPLGPVQSVALSGNVAVYSQGVTIEIADVSDPSNPVVLGATRIDGIPYEIAVSGSLAFVAAYDDGLFIVDISDPAAPIVAGHFSDQVYDVLARDNTVFLAASGLTILDATVPAAPVVIAVEPNWRPYEIVLSGDYIYGIDGGVLTVFDVTDPAAPTVENTFFGNYRHIAVSAERLFTTYGSRLLIHTLTDPGNPTAVHEYNTAFYLRDVAASGTLAVVTNTQNELRVIETTETSNPSTLSTWLSPGSTRTIAVNDSLAYLTATEGGLRWLDITDPANPTEVGSIDSNGFSYDIAIRGNYAFVAQRRSGLMVFDITDPDTPTPVGFLPLADAIGITIDGTRAIVAGFEAGVFIVDIENPSQPTLIGLFDTPGEAWTVEIAGQFAHVADGTGGLRIFDISNPGSVSQIGAMTDADSVMDIAVVGDVAYLADSCRGLSVVDVSNPAAPIRIGGTSGFDSFCAQAIDVTDNLAILVEGWYSTYSGEIFIFDVADPSAPQWITHFQNVSVKWTGWDLEVVGDILYVAYERVTVAYNLSDLQAPALIGRYFAPGMSTGIDVVGNRAFVAALFGGVASVGCTECVDTIFADGFEEWLWYSPWSGEVP